MTEAAKEVCGQTTKHRWQKQTWWWNEAVEAAVKAKYGWQFTAISLVEKVRTLGRSRGPSCAVVMTVDG